jgi:4-amino-4-deoxy-L-arabinose transferase-like glycosyltransferase
VWVVAAAVCLRGAAAQTAPLIDDEAYYWLWAQHLDWGYLDHPPLIAWLIALTTTLSDSAFLIRVSALACGALTSYVLFLLGRDLFSARAGVAAAVLFQVVPVLAGSGLLATPDAPLLLYWALAMRFGWQAFQGRPARWLAAGAAAGLGLLSKMPMVLLPAGFMLYAVLRARRVLRAWQLYAGGALAAVMFVPVLVWNAQHGWAGVSYVVSSRLAAGSSSVTGLTGVGKLLEEQMPFALALLPAYAWALTIPLRRRGEPFMFLMLVSLPALVFPFIPAYAGAWPHGNWLAPVYLAYSLVLGAVWNRFVAALTALNGAAIAWGLAASLIPALPLLPGAEEVYGWREAGDRVTAELQGLQGGTAVNTGALARGAVAGGAAIIADRYQVAAQLGYHAPGHPVMLLPCSPRGSIWTDHQQLAGRSGVAVIDARWDPVVRWAEYAERVEEAPPLRVEIRGRPLRVFRITRLHGLKAPPACR